MLSRQGTGAEQDRHTERAGVIQPRRGPVPSSRGVRSTMVLRKLPHTQPNAPAATGSQGWSAGQLTA